MKTFKFLAALALVAGLSTSAFAGNPKGETKDTKDAKIEVPTSSENTTTLNFYYVTGVTGTGTHYTLSPNPPAGGCPNNGALPCRISTNETLGSQVEKERVDDEDGISIEDTRASFN